MAERRSTTRAARRAGVPYCAILWNNAAQGAARKGEAMETIDEEAGATARFIDARTALVVYVRVLAIAFLVSGLRRWAVVLGPLAPGGDFFNLSPEWMVAIGFFAVFELVAAVGLWLLASWGTVVWLIAASTEVVLHTVFRDTFGFEPVILAFHATTVVIYAILTFIYERAKPD